VLLPKFWTELSDVDCVWLYRPAEPTALSVRTSFDDRGSTVGLRVGWVNVTL
jgi:hypothetical protein